MSHLTTSMVNWLEDMSAEKLMNLELIFKRVRLIKGLISQKEKEIKSLDELFVASLYAVMGKSRQKVKEEKRQEIMCSVTYLADSRIIEFKSLGIHLIMKNYNKPYNIWIVYYHFKCFTCFHTNRRPKLIVIIFSY